MPQTRLRGASQATFALLLLLCAVSPVFSHQDQHSEFDTLADRYWQLLQERPQFGTTFDLWYRHYLDAGRLDDLQERIDRYAEQNPARAPAQLLRGLVKQRQGDLDEAALCYRLAEKLDPTLHYPPYALAQLLERAERFEEAIAAYKRSINRKPPRTVLLDAYEHVGKLELRLGRRDRALAAWDALVDQFPGELTIIAELAEILREEQLYAESIERWRAVENQSRPHSDQRLQARLKIAEIELLRDEPDAALDLLEKSLAEVKPDSWLATEIRRRVEQVFERGQDASGLVAWCEQWLASHPDDIETQLYLATVLARSEKHQEAIAQHRRIIEAAPSHRKARELLVEELTVTGQYPEAIKECRILIERDAADIDARERLGHLYLKSSSKDTLPAAQQQAIAVWRQIADLRPEDPLLAVTAAELCDRASRPRAQTQRDGDSANYVTDDAANRLTIAAEELYREAVRRAAGEPRYYEYLGEFFHQRGRKEEAVSAWARTTDRPHNTAENWRRLAEIYSLFGYDQEAVSAGQKSLELNPDEFGWHDFQIELLLVAKRYDEAVEQLSHLEQLADSPQRERDSVHRYVQVYQAADLAEEQIDRLEQSLEAQPGAVRQHWRLALLLADRRQYPQAIQHLESAFSLTPGARWLLRDLALILERKGDVLAAIDRYEKLAKLDPARRITYYEKVIHLALRKDRPDRAKAAADRLIQIAPENTHTHQLWADVALRLNDIEAALEQLRRAVLVSPQDVEPRLRYAAELGRHGRITEAREHYWRCFELSGRLEERLSIVEELTTLGKDADSQNQLIERIERLRRLPGEKKTATLCLAQIHVQLERPEAARSELNEYLLQHPDDTDVLERTAMVCEKLQDWQSAIDYQERLVALSSDWRHVFTWARYYTEMNRSDWLSEARQNKEDLFRKWAETYRRYRKLNTLPDEKRSQHEAELKKLRNELQKLSWARDKFHQKEESLTGLHPGSSRTRSGWAELHAECETLEFVIAKSPVTAGEVNKKLKPVFEKTRTYHTSILNGLCERGYLNVRQVGRKRRYVPAGSREKLLEQMAYELGRRLIGGSIDLSGDDLTRLNRIVREVKGEE
jgi:superkiller protein 3